MRGGAASRGVSQTEVPEKVKTYILAQVLAFFLSSPL